MKTLGYNTVIFLMGIVLCTKSSYAQMDERKIYVEKVSVNINKPVTEKSTKRSDNALRVNFFKLLVIEMNRKMQNSSEISGIDDDQLIDYRGKVNIVFSISADKKIEVLNIFGNNPKLVSFIKEILEKEPLIVPQAIQGKYMIPVRF